MSGIYRLLGRHVVAGLLQLGNRGVVLEFGEEGLLLHLSKRKVVECRYL